jgi:Tol biopolymer transport system component
MSTFIAPDESYLIFSSADRKYGLGNADLYICYKKSNGKWTTPMNLGSKINSPSEEFCPMISKDGKYLFFLSFRSGKSYPYWVSAKIIEELRPKK